MMLTWNKVVRNMRLSRISSATEWMKGLKIRASNRSRPTDQCTMILKETIAYYVSNASPVFSVFFDATKAFDRVAYCKLFDTLLVRNLPPVFARLRLNMYTSHVTRIMWNGFFSDIVNQKRHLSLWYMNKLGIICIPKKLSCGEFMWTPSSQWTSC